MQWTAHLAVLQSQLKHFCCAANQTHADAVQHHSLTAVEDNRGQILWFYLTDKPAKAGSDRGLRLPGRTFQHCVENTWKVRRNNDGHLDLIITEFLGR